MSTQDSSKPASTDGGGGTTDEITKEFFLSLTPTSFEALPPARKSAVIKWLLGNPHHLERYQKKETTK